MSVAKFDQAGFDRERGAIFSSAIGIARLRLQDGDPAGALEVLDSAVERVEEMHREALLAAGYPERSVDLLLGRDS